MHYSSLITILFISIFSINSVNASCIPKFTYKNGWLGSDDAYSIKLPNKKTIWLFGDTFISKNKNLNGFEKREFKEDTIIGNSIAISKCEGPEFKHEYFFNDRNNKRSSFFQHPQEDLHYKYWPRDGFYHEGKVYIYQFDVIPTTGGNMGFAMPSTTLTIIENPLDHPSQWKMRFIKQKLPNNILIGSTVIKKDNTIYIYATLDRPLNSFQAISVFKTNIEDIEDNSKLYFLNNDQVWEKINRLDENADNLFQVMSNGSMELTIRFNKTINQWVAIYIGNAIMDEHIKYRLSSSPIGPWSEEKVLLPIKERNKNTNQAIAQPYCYAAKEHPQYKQQDNEIILSYICNSFDLKTILGNEEVYLPKIIKIDSKQLLQ